jgi:hypothetical protein
LFGICCGRQEADDSNGGSAADCGAQKHSH